MEDEFNNLKIETKEEEKIINESQNQKNKSIFTRKRKQLINKELDEDEEFQNKEKNISIPRIQNEELKEKDKTELLNENLKSQYLKNKFNTLESNNIEAISSKDSTALDKLKKIFLNRDKLKFQYSKQDIPDNLKYHSDDSETSEVSGLRKSKILKVNNINDNNQNLNIYTIREAENNSKINNNKEQTDGEIKKPDEQFSTFSPSNPQKSVEKNEEDKRIYSLNKKKEEKLKLNSYNEEENNKYKMAGFNYYNKYYNNNREEENEKKNDVNEKENAKKNILLKMFEKRDKHEIIQDDKNEKNLKDNHDDEEKEKKKRLLKMLFDKKETNSIENNDNGEQNEEISQNNKNELEKEERRRKIIEKLQSESINTPSNKKNRKFEKNEKSTKNEEQLYSKLDKEEKEEGDNDKGTYLSNRHKNKLTISIKPKENLLKQISSSLIEDKEEKEKNNINKEEEGDPKNKKTNALLDILNKLKKKKSEENISKKESKGICNANIDDDINESEIEREAERIRKKEKRMEERRMAREKQKNKLKIEKEQNNTNIYYGNKRPLYNQYRDDKINTTMDNIINSNKKEEMKRRRQLEEDLRAEINDFNKEDTSTFNNSTRSNNDTKRIGLDNEDKYQKKEYNRQTHIRNTVNIGKNIIDEGAAPNEMIINDMPKSYLDRSFDTGNTYIRRKIQNGRTTFNIYRPKRPDIRVRSSKIINNELIENNSSSFNPNNVININNINNQGIPYNYPNKLTYMRKKSSFNDNSNFLMNNSNYCEYQKENKSIVSINGRNNMNYEGGGLNSSFDAYMKLNINSKNNNLMNSPKTLFYSTATKKYNNCGYNRATHITVNNINYNNNSINNCFEKGNINNNDINRSFGYINTNNNINNNNDLKTRTKIINNKSPYINSPRQKFISYNNNNPNSNYVNNINNSPLRTYGNQINNNIQNDKYNYYQNSSGIKRYESNKIKGKINNIYNYNIQNSQESERNTSINIEDLMVLEEKLNEIIIALNKNHTMHNECFEFWNYYFNCSFYGKLEKLFKNENDCNNVQISINHIISVMISYDFSFEIEILNKEYSILVDILELNHRNLIIIYEHILSKISSESKSNPWVYKLHQLINNFNKMGDSDYISMNGRKFSYVEKITYNVTVIVQNIRLLLKNYKTKRIEYLTSIFKKINEKTYEEINSYFIDNILRVDNVNGSVLASVFLKENKNFQTEPAPYIKTKNRKKYSLILDLDETLVHFKVNNEDDSEGVLRIRPGVIQFLELVGKYYELIVFTAATQDYGDLLIDAIEENNLFFEHRFYRQHTVIIGNDFVKDLNRIGRPIDKIIIVDNMPQNFRLQKENGINIKAFWGEDANDNALEELGKILINIAEDGGDVRIGLEKYRDEIVKKVTSNISKSNY